MSQSIVKLLQIDALKKKLLDVAFIPIYILMREGNYSITEVALKVYIHLVYNHYRIKTTV